ncbi:hypothetical protein [Aquibacillus sediminis]|uniref:hypothetical protein n=1 Tax=Aquibacillus sediminis TaxID=2574734 RepID=UPI0011086191|nr:hypothetical protein [Aquibacillus sediminis]
MTYREYQVLANKAVEVAPDWLKDDIKEVFEKKGRDVGSSFIVSQLHHLYSFGLRHIFTATDLHFDWSKTARERLTFIDNNLDVVDLLIKKYRKELKEE